ncbi:hypothetical protein Patl1_33089 [Pistacia atlantica]|uniref:Uncharacterized protein n=1 Tax=Pistacia atlantica TaxID=434234 RepID=A0ACC1AQE7_9ROSI|nr:hypothetical protein Patl1_33089 [Pistacia atlantica]
MILGYGQLGMSKRAVSWFHRMQECDSEPDAVTFVAMLSACSYAGLVDEGLHIFELMESKYKIQPSTEHYCFVADMLCRVGWMVEAYEFVQKIGEEGNVLEIWGSLGACRLHGKSELHGIQFEGMESYLIDMYAKSGLIKASQQIFERNHPGDRDQATWKCYDCWEQMLHGLQNSTRAYSRSSASSSAMGQHDHGVAREVDAIYRLLPVCASVPMRDLRGYST